MSKPKQIDKKERPVVAIHRPEAVVTVVIDGQQHKLNEAEAKDLHAQLSKALNVEPQIIYRDRPVLRWGAPPAIPVPCPPQFIPHPDNEPFRVTC